MSIVIRHGTNGGFKTATAVNDYVIPALKEGRTIVTNIRGLTREKAFEKWPDLPESLEIINVDTASEKGKETISRWFHWVPNGALLVFDEASSLFPKAWRETDLRKLDYPGGEDQAAQDHRPPNWITAWEMHRHYNWDVVLTTPNIKAIRDDIRGTTEMAYRHRNIGALSDKFRMFKEVQHDAQKNGFSHSDAINITTRRVSTDCFDLYQTTDTGLHQGSKAGKSLWSNPKVLLLAGILVAVVAFVADMGGPSLFGDDSQGDRPAGETSVRSGPQSVPLSTGTRGASGGGNYRRNVSNGRGRAPDPVDPFAQHELNIVGTINGRLQVEARRKGDAVFLTIGDLGALGYRYTAITDCIGRLDYKGSERLIMCTSNDSRRTASEQTESVPTLSMDGA